MCANSRRWGALLMLIVTAILAYGSYWLVLISPSYSMGTENAYDPCKYAAIIASSGWFAWAVLALSPKRGDNFLVPGALFLVSVSWLEIYSLGFRNPLYSNQGPRQAISVAVALLLMLLTVLLLRNYRVLEEYKYLFLSGGVIAQLAVMIFGAAANGARLWFNIGGFSLQPGEFTKICFIIFFAAYLRQFSPWMSLGITFGKESRLSRKALLILGTSMAVAELVLVAQRDLGAALLLFGIFIAMFFIATGRADIVAITAVLSSGGAYLCWKFFDHVQIRVSNWLDPFADIGNNGYQMCLALFCLNNAGFDGAGLGLGFSEVIPEVSNDFAFVAITEDFGLIGCTALILGVVILVERCFAAAMRAQDQFGVLLASGLASLFAWQSAIIMLGDTKIIPMTGITLPFVSAGGSSLASSFIILGIIWSIDASNAEIYANSLRDNNGEKQIPLKVVQAADIKREGE